MPFVLPELPFDKSALEPHMSAETLEYHHGKHHKAYVDKTNELVAKEGMTGKSLVEVIKGSKGTLFNQSAQIWNHSFFWLGLTPNTTEPTGDLKQKIDSAFGSKEELVKQLAAESAAHFASGWGWLVLDGDSLKITSYHDADTPIVHGVKPLLTVDVWEHAYYIDYRNQRPKYLETVLGKLINWDFVAQNLDGKGADRADQQG